VLVDSLQEQEGQEQEGQEQEGQEQEGQEQEGQEQEGRDSRLLPSPGFRVECSKPHHP
jgi:hypothetical protein